jgi:transposase InsO family protein
MFMSIWLAHFPALLVSLISSPSWTGRPAGRKWYRLPPCPPLTAQPDSFMDGSSGSAYPQPSPTSDRGPQFASSLWSALCSLLNISHLQTTAYHPQANGAVERFHRRLKDALLARAAGADWYSHLPWVLLGIRSPWRENSQFSPAEAVFGAQPVLQGQFLSSPEPPSPTFLQELQQTLNNRTPPPQLPWAAQPSRRAPAHPLCPCSPQWCAAFPIADVRRAIPGSGKVFAFLQTPGGNEARYTVTRTT